MVSVEGHVKVVQILLEANAHADAADKDGNTPSMHACESRHKRCVKVLLNVGADVSAVGGDGTPLILAATWGRENLIQILIDAGANIDARCKYRKSKGRPPMRRGNAIDAATEAGYTKIVQMLLKSRESERRDVAAEDSTT